METTGGLSKAAFNFCKEIKKRYESLNCYVDSECPRNYEINMLQSAINVELQRANSRMVLERTPLLEDLIETDMVKCELAVVKKKENAIEMLRLERLRPKRIHKSVKTSLNDENSVQPTVARSSTKVSGNNCGRKCLVEKTPKIPAKKLIKTERGANSSMRNSSNLPGLSSLDPKPLEEEMRQNLDTTRVLSMEWENEERSLAPKSDTSQKPSTSAVPKEIKQRVLIKKKKGEGDVMKKTGVFRNISPRTTSSPKYSRQGRM